MGEQLNSIKKENNFQNFIQSQRKTLDEINLTENANIKYNNKPLALLELDGLFEFLEVNFNEFHEIQNFNAIVPFLHRSLKQWSENRDASSIDIGTTLFYLLDQHVNDEADIIIVVQIIVTILNYLKSIKNNKDTQMSGKVFLQLTEILPKIENAKLVSDTISCLQLYIEMHPNKRHAIMQSLWTDLRQQLNEKIENAFPTTTEIDILVKLYDEFYEINQNISEDATIIAAIQKLLRSDQKDNRKNGYIIFRKMITFLVKKLQNFSFLLTSTNSQQIEHLWLSYINILENLEEEQSEIIISKLENIKQIVESKQLQTSWLEILYIRLLTHGSIEVAYWTMEYFLKTFVYSDLSDDIIEKLLKTSNSMWLYNHEGYCLDLKLFKSFLKGDLKNLYELMGDIEWKSIPLYIWIKAIYDNEKEVTPTMITYEQLLKLSSRVYNFDCWLMHREIVKLFKTLFEKMIDNMSMKEYVEYVETLYTTTYYAYNDFEKLHGKILHLLELDDEEYIFSQRFYEILVKNLPNTDVDVNKFMKFLNKIPRKQHGWLRFIPYHYYGEISDENIEKFNVLYDINTNALKTCQLTEIIKKFEQCFLTDLQTSQDKRGESVIHCRIAAIAFYIQQKNSFDQEDNETIKIIFDPEISEYNNMMKIFELWEKLCKCLENTNKKLETWIIDEFLKRICGDTVGDKILKYLSKTYDENTKNKYFEIILDKYPRTFYNVLHNYVNPLKLSNQSRFFNGDLDKDELRIEQLFCYNQFDTYDPKPISLLKQIWINGVRKYCNEEYILYLLECHKELSKKNPIYEENSNEHRIKLRILLAISFMETKNIYTDKIFNEIWNILLNENNQLNICYIYEYIIGSYDTRLDVILEKLKQSHTLTPNQQRSIISVAYTFCMRRPIDNIESMDTVITNLISLTMCYNTETSILAQITLYKLLNTENFKNQTYREQIIQTIKNVMGTNLNEYLNDFRLHMHENQLIKWADLVVLFVTKAQFDPMFFVHYAYFSNSTKFFSEILIKVSPQLQDQINKCREAFVEKNK